MPTKKVPQWPWPRNSGGASSTPVLCGAVRDRACRAAPAGAVICWRGCCAGGSGGLVGTASGGARVSAAGRGCLIRGRGCGARAKRMMACDARISSSLTCRRARSSRRGTVRTCPGRGRRVAGMAVTSFAVRDGREAGAVRRDGLAAAGGTPGARRRRGVLAARGGAGGGPRGCAVRAAACWRSGARTAGRRGSACWSCHFLRSNPSRPRWSPGALAVAVRWRPRAAPPRGCRRGPAARRPCGQAARVRRRAG